MTAEFDLVVSGAGVGGMAVAVVAASEGLRVLVCESSGEAGGTGATSVGSLWLPGHGKGYPDDRAEAQRYLAALIGSDVDAARRYAFLDTIPAALACYERLGALDAVAGPQSDYHEREGAAARGRVLSTRPFDGRRLGTDFARIRPPMPEMMVLGGMMVDLAEIATLRRRYRSWVGFRLAASLALRHLSDRFVYRRGTRLVMGNALVARLFESLKARRVEVRFDTRIERLVVEGGSVTGAILRSGDTEVRVASISGVVLATGGLVGSRGYLADRLPQTPPPVVLAADSDTGDGIRLAQEAGAALREAASPARWVPVSRVTRRDGSVGWFPFFGGRGLPGMIAVDTAGRRFVNEAISYNEFVVALQALRDHGRDARCWLVCSARAVARYGLGPLEPCRRPSPAGLRRLGIVRASTLAGLASSIGVPAESLIETVTRHDAFAPTGIDPDFGRGATAHERAQGDPAQGPNPCLGPVGDGPYHAIALQPAVTTIASGLNVDGDGRVLSYRGEPVPGLYAAGNDAATIMAGTDPGPGASLGPILVFAYRTGMHAAGRTQSIRA